MLSHRQRLLADRPAELTANQANSTALSSAGSNGQWTLKRAGIGNITPKAAPASGQASNQRYHGSGNHSAVKSVAAAISGRTC